VRVLLPNFLLLVCRRVFISFGSSRELLCSMITISQMDGSIEQMRESVSLYISSIPSRMSNGGSK